MEYNDIYQEYLKYEMDSILPNLVIRKCIR